jgi:hypothetical protein
LIRGNTRKRRGSSNDAGTYRRVFLGRVHQLIELGYRKLAPANLAKSEETEITGELVRSMDEVIDDPTSVAWVRYFSVHDDPPVNAPGRKGKSRQRLDVKIVSAQRHPRNRFSFEAKRLGRGNPVGKYLGPKGLGCFLNGEYAVNEDDAGMLGYVRSKTPQVWAEKLRVELEAPGTAYAMGRASRWQPHKFRFAPAHVYLTTHVRHSLKRDVAIYHTLLTCW